MNDSPTIVIVDDDDFSRERTRSMIDDVGYHTVTLDSGVRLLHDVVELDPDVILLDIAMPEMSGFEVCRELKSGEETQLIPVLLLTGNDSDANLVAGLEAGADGFVSKDARRRELQARVRAALRIRNRYEEFMKTLIAREELSDFVCHDLRSPLVRIRQVMELHEEQEPVSDAVATVFQRIRTEIGEIESLVDSLLLPKRLTSKSFAPFITSVDLAGLIRAVADRMADDVKRTDTTVTFAFPDNGPSCIYTDEFLIKRVVDNLLSNAIKYSPRGTTVTIRLEYHPHVQHGHMFAVVQVIDQGYAIDAKDLEKIFEPFEVASTPSTNVMRVGLGLTFCKKVMELLGGNIRLERNVEKGMTSTFEFPVMIEEEKEHLDD